MHVSRVRCPFPPSLPPLLRRRPGPSYPPPPSVLFCLPFASPFFEPTAIPGQRERERERKGVFGLEEEEGEGREATEEKWRRQNGARGREEESGGDVFVLGQRRRRRTHYHVRTIFLGRASPAGEGAFCLTSKCRPLSPWFPGNISFPSPRPILISFPSRKKNTLLGGRERKVYLWEGDQRGRREGKLVFLLILFSLLPYVERKKTRPFF